MDVSYRESMGWMIGAASQQEVVLCSGLGMQGADMMEGN
jgi:hypothetical protein